MNEFLFFMFLIFVVPAVLVGSGYVIDQKINGPRYAFEHSCVLDQGLDVSNDRDTYCIYPKENKIVRFVN